MSRRSVTLLLTLAAIWGSSYLLIKIGGRDLSPPMIAFGRIALGAAVLVPLALRARALRGLAGLWPMILAVSIAQVAAPFILIALGEEEISSSLAGILVASAPIFTAILAIFFDAEERSHGAQVVGVFAGVVGLALLLGVDVGGSGGELLGALAVVLAGLGYAIGGLLAKRRLGTIQPIGIAALVLSVSTVLSLPAALLTLPDEMPGLGPVMAVAGARRRGHRDRVRDLLRADRDGRPREDLPRHLPGAGVRRRLRRGAARRGLRARHPRRPAADPRRLLPRGSQEP